MSVNPLEVQLSELAVNYGWPTVLEAIERLMRNEVQATRRCWYTRKPLAHIHVCQYCKHKCPLAGGRK